MTLSVHVEGGICFPGSCPSSPGLHARPAICSGAGPPPPTVTFSRNNRLPAGCSRRRSVRKRTCQPLPQPAWRLVCVNSPAGLSAAAPPGSVRAREGGDAWLPWAPAEGLAAGAPGQTLSPASVLCYCSRWGFRRSDQVTARLAPPLSGPPPLLRTGPPSSWPRVGRAPRRMALLLAARVSSARLPVCSLQSRPVGRTLFPVPLLTRILCRACLRRGRPAPRGQGGAGCPSPAPRVGISGCSQRKDGRARALGVSSGLAQVSTLAMPTLLCCPGLIFALRPQLPSFAGVCLPALLGAVPRAEMVSHETLGQQGCGWAAGRGECSRGLAVCPFPRGHRLSSTPPSVYLSTEKGSPQLRREGMRT